MIVGCREKVQREIEKVANVALMTISSEKDEK